MHEHEQPPLDFSQLKSGSSEVFQLDNAPISLAKKAIENINSPVVETNTDFFEIPETQELSPVEAIVILSKGNGFYPHDNVEKESLLGIAGRSNNIKFPVIRYFQEIHKHQENSISSNPVAALRLKVREFAGYAKQSDNDIKMAKLFERTKVERHFRDGALVSEAISASYLEDDLTTRQALTTLARLRELDLFVQGNGEGDNPLGTKSGINVLVGKELTARILELFQGVRISSLMDLNTRMMNEASSRFTYWRDRVSETKLYGSKIWSVSNELLTDLDQLRPTQKP